MHTLRFLGIAIDTNKTNDSFWIWHYQPEDVEKKDEEKIFRIHTVASRVDQINLQSLWNANLRQTENLNK